MSKCLLLAGALLLTISAAGQARAVSPIVGKWRAHSMKAGDQTRTVPEGTSITLELQKNGTFIGTMEARDPKGPPRKQVERGTWKVEGEILTTTIAEHTESMKFTVRGATLTLTKLDRGEQLILKRTK